MRIGVRTAVEATPKDTVDLDVGRKNVEDDAVGFGDDHAEVVFDGFGSIEAVAAEVEEAIDVSSQVEKSCEVGGSSGAEDVGRVVGGGGFLEGLDDVVEVSVGKMMLAGRRSTSGGFLGAVVTYCGPFFVWIPCHWLRSSSSQ
jgi:hypothetical protein